MNKKDLTDAVAGQMGSTKDQARRFIDCVFSTISGEIASGDKVTIAGFGSFDRRHRPGRTARNPLTGAEVAVAETHVVRFRPAQYLRDLAAGRGRQYP